MGMGYPGYQDTPYGVSSMQQSFSPGHHIGPSPNTTQPFFSPIASPLPSPAVASFDESMPPMQHASLDAAMGAPVYFSRHDSSSSRGHPDASAMLTDIPNPHESMGSATGAGAGGYATLDRDSVTPYQAQQYAAISQQLSSPVHGSIPEGAPAPAPAPAAPVAASNPVHEQSPFEDPAPGSIPALEDHYQELTLPSPAHARIDSSPPMIPPMRTMSPVGAVAAARHSSIIQIASAFPAAPMSSQRSGLPAALMVGIPAFPAPVANVASRGSSLESPAPGIGERSLPLSPAPGAQGQIQLVSVPEGVHAGRETPVQFGFNEPGEGVTTTATGVTEGAEAKAGRCVSVAPTPNPKRMSVASKKSAKSGRPETMYDEDDAYGGI